MGIKSNQIKHDLRDQRLVEIRMPKKTQGSTARHRNTNRNGEEIEHRLRHSTHDKPNIPKPLSLSTYLIAGNTDVCYPPATSSIHYPQSLAHSRVLRFLLVPGGGVFVVSPSNWSASPSKARLEHHNVSLNSKQEKEKS
jgi:hypothetical protein